MKKKMLVFDVDGVLLDNQLGGIKDILVFLGRKEEVMALDEEYHRRKHVGPWGLEQVTELYRGVSQDRLRELALIYCCDSLMEGAEDIVKEAKSRDYVVGALSSNPQFLMDALRQLLVLDFAKGSELEFKNEVATGRITKKVDRYVKAELLKAKFKEYGISKGQVVVIGDSLTDIPMAEEAGKFIAFNAKEEAKKSADVVIGEKDLRELNKYLGD